MSTHDVLLELLAPPPMLMCRATVELSAAQGTQRWDVDFDRWEGSWTVRDLGTGEEESWDAASRVLTTRSGRSHGPSRSLWQLPAPGPVRMLAPRLWPIWGRKRSGDQHALSAAHNVDDHLWELAFTRVDPRASAEIVTALFDAGDQIFREFVVRGTQWRAAKRSDAASPA